MKTPLNVLNSLRHSGVKIHQTDFFLLENSYIKYLDFSKLKKHFNLESQEEFLEFIRNPENFPDLFRYGERNCSPEDIILIDMELGLTEQEDYVLD